jgi:hypothetical protein
LLNIANLAAPGGYLFTWGVDLDVRTHVVQNLGLSPILDKIQDVHNADQPALRAWPLLWWGLEPLDKGRPDWAVRYATVFQAPHHAKVGVGEVEEGEAFPA